jgi:hypothetical protein
MKPWGKERIEAAWAAIVAGGPQGRERSNAARQMITISEYKDSVPSVTGCVEFLDSKSKVKPSTIVSTSKSANHVAALFHGLRVFWTSVASGAVSSRAAAVALSLAFVGAILEISALVFSSWAQASTSPEIAAMSATRLFTTVSRIIFIWGLWDLGKPARDGGAS